MQILNFNQDLPEKVWEKIFEADYSYTDGKQITTEITINKNFYACTEYIFGYYNLEPLEPLEYHILSRSNRAILGVDINTWQPNCGFSMISTYYFTAVVLPESITNNSFKIHISFIFQKDIGRTIHVEGFLR